MHFPSRLPLLLSCLCGLATVASAQGTAPAAEWLAFQKLTKGKQAEVVAQVLEGLPQQSLLTALQALAHAANEPRQGAKPRPARRGKRTIEFPQEDVALPRRCDYLFGIGTIEARVAARAEQPAPKAARPGSEKVEPVLDTTSVQQALLGCVPDADRAAAAILQRLDLDTTADTFAAFMHSWRNGEESFYEALDRTAGTERSVFFFDSMLDDFRGQFGGAHSEPPLRGGLQAAHDALHGAFLAYRQYRGFREAVAWSLVLPPEQPFPARLARYEAKVAGAYSLREQVTMVLFAMHDDVEQLLTTITKTAAPLQKPLWAQPYDPYPAWNATFVGLLPTMIDRAGSSDAFLRQAIAERADLARTIADLARQRVLAASQDGAAH